ncbi:hypothetical protein CORC01_00049 [Colletotrichum orchidophilum]|uniref:Uncharacterized protein n=1 Tax=Colletotrichum orchidophilum TaxID=1209926 RepID=A0A1G4BT68_9PEZI|nr:uncharacterized protein CORC01_00049 [Colletotrichum orchidophilum]OHF04578.1 hypothetical protein CORC01_00049 [Colletotrichum orchidophilum]
MAGRCCIISILLVAGVSLQTAALMTVGWLETIDIPFYGVRSGVSATVTLFGIGFGLGWTPSSPVVAAETPTTGATIFRVLSFKELQLHLRKFQNIEVAIQHQTRKQEEMQQSEEFEKYLADLRITDPGDNKKHV